MISIEDSSKINRMKARFPKSSHVIADAGHRQIVVSQNTAFTVFCGLKFIEVYDFVGNVGRARR